MDSTATGPPAASSRARRTAALLNGAPEDASSTAAGAVDCWSKRRRPNSIYRGPGYLTTGGSPEGSGPLAGSLTGAAPALPPGDALPPSAVPPAPAAGPAAPTAAAAGVPVAPRLRSCDRRHQYSGAYRATMTSPSR